MNDDRWLKTKLVVSLAGMSLVLLGAGCDLGAPPALEGAWQKVSKASTHTDHSTFFDEAFESGPAVTRACLGCHEDASSEVMKTAHWRWEGEEVLVPGHEKPTRIGKKNVINNFCIGVQSNWAACTSCHAGYGWEDETFDFEDKERVDCLICHDNSGTYQKKAKGAGWPADNVDLLAVARSVGQPTRANCGACHFRGGGGNGIKHGDLDDSMLNPDERIDVHMGRMDFSCVDCHKTKDHQIPGRSMSVSVGDTQRVRCSDCHKGQVHGDARLDAHTERVACQTCHIPAMAVETPTKMTWDWSEAGQDLPIKDKHVYMKIKGRFTFARGAQPEYAWYNETSTRYLMGDVIDPNKPTKITQALGEKADPKSKIWPMKVHRGKQPYDKQHNYFLVPNVHGEQGYWTKFDWDLALKNGAKVTGFEYSGEYGFAPTEMSWPLSHMVAPKKDALACQDCHGEQGRLDWKDLGYEGDPLLEQADEHETIGLLDGEGQSVLESGKALSLTRTCGKCHELDDDDFVAAHRVHAKLDPAGLAPERRALLAYGPQLAQPDGAEANCLLCHLEGVDAQARNAALLAGQADWSISASLLGTGLINPTKAGYAWRAEGFDEEKQVELALQSPQPFQCGSCHGLVHQGKEPVHLQPSPSNAWVTEATGQVFSGQRIHRSGLNLTGKDALWRPWDVHAERLVSCADCHSSAELPKRLADGPKPAKAAEPGKTRACENCHALEGRHAFLPEQDSHFQALACEACHVPLNLAPTVQVIDRTLMDPAGRPGRTLRNVEGDMTSANGPTLLAGKDGRLTPNNLITTWRWVRADGQAVAQAKLRAALFDGAKYRPEVLAVLDGNSDGTLSGAELRLDTEAKLAVVRKALEGQGLSGVRIDGRVIAKSIHHGVARGSWAKSACTDCHLQQGKAERTPPASVELSPYMPGGTQPVLSGSLAKAGELVKEGQRLILRPSAESDR